MSAETVPSLENLATDPRCTVICGVTNDILKKGEGFQEQEVAEGDENVHTLTNLQRISAFRALMKKGAAA